MTEILLIRHPETDLAGTFCGHSDPPINAAGEAQLAGLVGALENDDLDVVYSSDLQRAQTLAQAIAESHRVPCFATAALREIDFGDWESLSWAEIEQANPEQAACWLARYPDEPAPKGELLPAFQQRVLAAFDHIVTAPEERIAIVTHGGVIRTILTSRFAVEQDTALALSKPYCCLIRYNNAAVTR